ncbi:MULTISPECIES: maltose alpha-D-glucosyltransferase [Corynebacterium]|uniref:maltose alpha-D-glucosyltransferase n=2 Tax=Corynebacterium glucuronolyticum TaxID=39791 RepID=A0AAX1L646_9CORY|nr:MULTISPECIES: maltose alpha-D-glucosyltransferase [Corynebacterium]EEI62199.1 maltose alpha-D-glucosyltransferase [Corynebacterium glucuronolyticum ATCC 51866]OFO42481.1 trehalose synthase [Corynebacterium sp. HMSC073D01]QQU89160.1 maltose alpha-D-glucosyltransferase [Corynebacterium glucuronolyticum]QRP69943.1 maltose alpha-D-glucosyltransferase [Corynebacterium glucuronolyticum]
MADKDNADYALTPDGLVKETSARNFPQASPAPGDLPWEKSDPEWYKSAVFYEVLVRAFYDSNGDGTGDLKGLTEKLEYIKWLGVDCIWLPPFYDSPLSDGGYDIRDFRKILPEFGTVDDFVALVDGAHKLGLRVITDMVVNHTSDEHPWFTQSVEDPDGPYGDFYVWSDTDDAYSDARIIFVDTETSNWTYNEKRGQYYWHRFFHHQPDLNYDNPKVQEAILDAMRFWLDLGLDGFRLDAVPYLFEREGTNCENLPETHAFLKRCRAMIDEEYPGRILLAEANQWPVDVVEYFGEPTVGDECHMCFHFPVMPRIFMASRMQSRDPISSILRSTPVIPDSAQWGIFLRNHDELTLEMVSEDERAYMYQQFAYDPRMKSNVGIRRRLAPLLEGDRNQLELFTALLLSLPGSPVLYYGDEIGMGDNIWLGDRDGVRTPMQWSPDRNGGFSSADPEKLYAPVIMNAEFGYGAINVETQRRRESSLLNWTRSLIHIRKQYDAFGKGEFKELPCDNVTVFSFVLTHEDETILCVNNLSSRPQPARLDLSEFAGGSARELTGGEEFPPLTDSWTLTLPPYGFFWFDIS